MPRTISFLGSVALLVSNITGPPLVVIPLLYQQAGWLTPVLTFFAIALLSGTAALFLVEAMSSIEGNQGFQASIEFTTIARLFLGERWHIIVQCLLYLSMQCMVIASLLEAFQSMDELLISVVHKTCAVSFTDGWICVNQTLSDSVSTFSGYILFSFGTLITLSMILPLSLLRLADNIIFQVVAFIVLLVITILWIVIFIVKGLGVNSVPVVGRDHSAVVGFILSNFSFVMTAPAWVNETHPSVNIRLAVWMSILISCLIYIPIGWIGGSAFIFADGTTLLHVLVTGTEPGALRTLAQVSTYMFPLAVLISSVPVFTIVIRYNLLRGNIFSKKWAIFWSAVVPWLIVIPLQTNGALTIILNWGSLIFTSPSNLLIPFILFIASKRHVVFASSADPEMSLATAQQTMTYVENTSEVVLNSTGSAVLSHDNMRMEMEASRDSGEVAVSTMDVVDRMGSLSQNGHRRHEFPSEVGLSTGAEMSLMQIQPETPMVQTAPRTEDLSTVSRANTDSTAVDNGSTERVKDSEELGEEGRSQLRATPMSDPHFPQVIQNGPEDGPETLAGTGASGCPDLYLAFPFMSPSWPIRSTHISAIGILLAAILVLIAIVYNIVQSAGAG